MNGYLTALKRVLHGEEGASMVEYGLLVALIAVVCIAAVTAVGLALKAKFESVETAVENAGGSGGTTP
jgi:pilus assembly protein Flp/PilA